MKSTRWLWRTVGFAALLSTVLCAVGFAYGINQIIFPKPVARDAIEAPQQPAAKPKTDNWEAKEQIRIVALGDSLSAGTGDLSGKGYVGGVRDKLEKQLDKPVFVYNNFAIPGYRTADMLKDWDKKSDIAKSLAEADLVLLTIGGNDLFQSGAGIFSLGDATNGSSGSDGTKGTSGADSAKERTSPSGQAAETPKSTPGSPEQEAGAGFSPKAAADRMPDAVKRLEQIFDRVSKASPQARIFYVGLYHPFLDLDPQREGAPVIRQWNAAAFDLANRYPNITLVPTYDLFELNLSKYLYTDHFHPNKDGYDRIADRIVDILK
ncbi:GDSL-type esterase/lipase family protein [Paenibacillus sp. MZ04-78.2]|uniref:GDSL-type esterase/lipase family protein n=1 Tax=Paenibacillus sp. MZ04-78.2 TaxID=2962034 RepID=UPI0020B8DE7C|nr:GDSL-type esterase/lipase family protein [Paenibacillus sp. MZ04-78.2]MCP3772392.1 GDSL-type esterase/lipase family protein [Paenibacillus sp. MZ04-78.2]